MRRENLVRHAAMLIAAVGTSIGVGTWAQAQLNSSAATIDTAYRGYLEHNGQPVTGAIDLEVELYDANDGSTRLAGPIELADVSVMQGTFSTVLPVPITALGHDEVWVQIRIDGASEPIGRQRLLAAPYAGRSKDFGQPGDVLTSILNEQDFRALHGPGWVLMDGRDITGTALATLLCPSSASCNAPDARGLFLRGKNNDRADGQGNPSGELALGTYQADAFASHNHGGGVHRHDSGQGGGQRSGYVGYDIVVESTINDYTGYTGYSDAIIHDQGGNETRPKSLTVNYFVRVD